MRGGMIGLVAVLMLCAFSSGYGSAEKLKQSQSYGVETRSTP